MTKTTTEEIVLRCNCVQHETCLGNLKLLVFKGARIGSMYFTESQHHNGFDMSQENMRDLAYTLTTLAAKMEPLERE